MHNGPFTSRPTIMTNRRARGLRFVALWLALVLRCIAGRAAEVALHPVAAETNGVVTIEYRSGNTLVWHTSVAAPAGVELLLPGAKPVPVEFRSKTRRGSVIELGPT